MREHDTELYGEEKHHSDTLHILSTVIFSCTYHTNIRIYLCLVLGFQSENICSNYTMVSDTTGACVNTHPKSVDPETFVKKKKTAQNSHLDLHTSVAS